MVPVCLLEPREVWPGPWRVPIEELKPVLTMVCFPIWNHIW